VRRYWEREIVSLFPLPSENSHEILHGVRYFVAEAVGRSDSTPDSTWVSVDSLDLKSFADASDYAALRSSLARCCSDLRHPEPGPFAKLGWLSKVRSWIAQAIGPSGLRLLGPFRQLNASPSFSLIRFETNGPAVWFKAVGEPNVHEYRIITLLTKLRPNGFPTILASRDDWCGWLMEEAKGAPPNEKTQEEAWRRVAFSLARLQGETRKYADELCAAGCRDLRTPQLLTCMPQFLGLMISLMERQIVRSPAPLSPSQLDELEKKLVAGCQILGALPWPDSLGQSDFSLGNLLIGPDRIVFLDWAEAHVGCPVFTLEYLLALLQKQRSGQTSWQDSLRKVYSAYWQSVLPRTAVTEALRLGPLLAVYAYALALCTPGKRDRSQDPSFASYLRSLGRRMYREAQLLRL